MALNKDERKLIKGELYNCKIEDKFFKGVSIGEILYLKPTIISRNKKTEEIETYVINDYLFEGENLQINNFETKNPHVTIKNHLEIIAKEAGI
ncbi:MAG: hypothetical protein WDZ62_00265 [Candidatus Pacearchaeota archaeon]